MTAPLPFTVHSALPCQPHAGFAASLAAELAHEPAWRCGHQVADRLLDEVELRCALPFDDDAGERAGLALRRLRARLN